MKFNAIIRRRRDNKKSDAESFEFLRNLIVTEENRKFGFFDAAWYGSAYPDVVNEGLDPFFHYMNHGYLEGRNPGPNFHTDYYRERYSDVAEAGVNPLVHFVQSGRAECRAANSAMEATLSDGVVRHVIAKEMTVGASGEAAIFVTHAPAGRLKPHILPYIELLNGNGISVLLVAVVDRPLELTSAEMEAAAGIIVRDNAGYDFGAWTHALKIEPSLFGASLLLLTNDSIIPTADAEAFRIMIDRVRENHADVVGLTSSHEYGWHISSYFLGLKPKALSSWTFQHFIRDLKNLHDKDEVIQQYEVPFAATMQGGGLKVAALYSGTYSANPTLFSWRELVSQGFPFIKLLILRKKFLEDVKWPEFIKCAIEDLQENWREVLGKAGFDTDLIQSSIAAADFSEVPHGASRELLVDPKRFEVIAENHPLRVAYFGPWNYDNGLGSASRELLCALKQTDAQVNAYPITKSFHVHKLVCPAVPVIDFAGQPDIAVVHLNPDSWHLLTSEQRRVIQSAKQKIGYWVWETDILPPAWKHDLDSVDRIWAPSQYCADVFIDEVKVPVDVVPHPVRIPANIASDRESILKKMGVDPASRVILYIFDGASYLIRKNPEALIRAFALSGLKERGWTLLLKVKHLYDRPEAGKALNDLASSTPGTVLADISLAADDVVSLLSAADIYASPHCSEGFGLTVAEAMALGKPVVATDFGGTRDFLNATSGYPVTATRSTLEENHGHYLKGHSWAKVDEQALASALNDAAQAVTIGDATIGSAARAVIECQLSYVSVAEDIERSFAAAIADSALRSGVLSAPSKRKALKLLPAAPDVAIDVKAGVKFANVRFDKGIVAVGLNDDLSLDAPQLLKGDPDDWLIFAPYSSRMHTDAESIIRAAIAQRPDVSLFYADDAAIADEPIDRIRLKPEFDWTLLVAQDYIGAPLIIKRKVLSDLGGLMTNFGSAMLYDLVIRVAEAGRAIGRIPEVLLVHAAQRPVADISERRAALEGCNAVKGIELLEGATPNLLLQRRRFEAGEYPPVTILIPTNRTRRPGMEETYIEHLLGCIAQVNWPLDKITVIVGDNDMNEPSWATRSWPFQLVRITTPEHSGRNFNYAMKANRLWRLATDEHIVLMNDDASPSNPEWLNALVGFLIDQNVGCVGAKLFYEDGSIQHAGMFPALRTVVHAWLDWPADAKTYQDWAHTQREWSMITGAIFATRRSILDRVGGFDERFSLEFNDVDLCLRIRNLGYRVVYNPDAQFTHAEKASRGDTAPPGAEVALFLSRWSEWLSQDPASHPGYAKNRIDIVPAPSSDAWFLK